jgi:hypothetical protein
MKERANREAAEAKAEEVLKRYGMTKLPIDPVGIANQLKIPVQAFPPESRGVSGMLVLRDDNFFIFHATHITSEGFRRFSIAHELGHYFLDGHVDAVLDTRGQHESRAGFAESNPFELEADHFAAALLMPKSLVQPLIHKAEFGLAGIEAIAGDCNTSLPAAAIRYCGLIKLPVAIIQTEGPGVDYCFMSKDLQEFRGLRWPKKGSRIPTATHTFDFNQSRQRIEAAERWSEAATLENWFGSYANVDAVEDIVGLGSYGKTLTAIWTETFADELSEKDDDNDESWRPKFAHRR